MSTQHIKKKKSSNKTLNDTNKTLKLRDRESQRERGDERDGSEVESIERDGQQHE
jgi:hypothetical protein